jgi:hypothetical protein
MPMVDDHTEDRQHLVDYLLGNLPDEEAERLDERTFSDDEFLWRLRALENDLIDEYARGELSGPVKERFRSSYLSSPDRQARVAFAETLHTLERRTETHAVATASVPGGNTRRSAFSVPGGLAAAAVLVLAVASYLLVQNRRLRTEVDQVRAEQASLSQRAQDLQGQLQDERSTADRMRAEIDSLRETLAKLRPTAIASFLLLPPTRGVGRIPTVTIPRGTTDVTLRLLLETDDFPTYSAALREVAGGAVVSRTGPLTSAAEADRRAVVVRIPAGTLKSQTYTVDLSGQRASAPAELLTSYTFRVVLE